MIGLEAMLSKTTNKYVEVDPSAAISGRSHSHPGTKLSNKPHQRQPGSNTSYSPNLSRNNSQASHGSSIFTEEQNDSFRNASDMYQTKQNSIKPTSSHPIKQSSGLSFAKQGGGGWHPGKANNASTSNLSQQASGRDQLRNPSTNAPLPIQRVGNGTASRKGRPVSQQGSWNTVHGEDTDMPPAPRENEDLRDAVFARSLVEEGSEQTMNNIDSEILAGLDDAVDQGNDSGFVDDVYLGKRQSQDSTGQSARKRSKASGIRNTNMQDKEHFKTPSNSASRSTIGSPAMRVGIVPASPRHGLPSYGLPAPSRLFPTPAQSAPGSARKPAAIHKQVLSFPALPNVQNQEAMPRDDEHSMENEPRAMHDDNWYAGHKERNDPHGQMNNPPVAEEERERERYAENVSRNNRHQKDVRVDQGRPFQSAFEVYNIERNGYDLGRGTGRGHADRAMREAEEGDEEGESDDDYEDEDEGNMPAERYLQEAQRSQLQQMPEREVNERQGQQHDFDAVMEDVTQQRQPINQQRQPHNLEDRTYYAQYENDPPQPIQRKMMKPDYCLCGSCSIPVEHDAYALQTLEEWMAEGKGYIATLTEVANEYIEQAMIHHGKIQAIASELNDRVNSLQENIKTTRERSRDCASWMAMGYKVKTEEA